MTQILFRGARLLDPAAGIDGRRDVLIGDGRVVQVAPQIAPRGAAEMLGEPAELTVFDGEGLWLCPGMVDAHVHLREPGFTHKETVRTGSLAAAAGGYTAVICEPNTMPPIDSAERARELAAKAESEAAVRVYFKAAMTAGRAGERPNDIAALAAEESVVALSDDGDPVVEAALMASVCALAADADALLAPHCEDSPRALEQMAAGAETGFQPAQPYANEDRYVERDLRLAAAAGCRIHFSHVSMAKSIEAIARARRAAIEAAVTFEATPHHLLLCADDFPAGEAPVVNPPLRSAADREALRRALLDGSVDAIASDHAPHTAREKAEGAPGLIGLETTLGLVLTHLVGPGLLSPLDAVRLMSTAPARIFGLPGGTLTPGSPADLVLADPNSAWTVEAAAFRSKSRNTPFEGWPLRGRAVATFVAGRRVHADPAIGRRVSQWTS